MCRGARVAATVNKLRPRNAAARWGMGERAGGPDARESLQRQGNEARSLIDIERVLVVLVQQRVARVLRVLALKFTDGKFHGVGAGARLVAAEEL